MSRAAFRVVVQRKSCGQKNDLTLRKWKLTDATVTFKRKAKKLETNSNSGSPWLWILLSVCVCCMHQMHWLFLFAVYMVSYSTPPEFDCSFLYLLWSLSWWNITHSYWSFVARFQHMTCSPFLSHLLEKNHSCTEFLGRYCLAILVSIGIKKIHIKLREGLRDTFRRMEGNDALSETNASHSTWIWCVLLKGVL